jgi:DNA-binding winged helix-turn-helix (wHTH) protein
MLFRFDDIELDEDTFELRRAGRVVPVQRKVLETLFYFVRHPNRLITRSELHEGPWQGTIVTDAALDQVVMQARRIIAPQDRRREQPIRTVRGKGFRFVASVTTELPKTETVSPDSARAAAYAEKPGSAVQPRTTARLVGRTRELEELQLAVYDVLAGRGSLVLVRGDAGIGKTSLLERFCTEHQARGMEVEFHWARCWEAGGAPALWPWRELLRSFIDRVDASHAELLLGEEAADLMPLARNAIPEADASRPAGSFENEAQTRFRVFDSVRRVLARVCEQRPLVLLIEDLHQADEASLLLLRFLTRYLHEQRLLIVASMRPVDGERRSLIAPLLASATTRTIELAGLNSADVAALAKLRGFELSAAAVDRLLAASGGNPLLIDGTLRALPNLDVPIPAPLIGSAIHVPDAITDSIRRRLEALPSPTVAMLKTCSVLGRSFSLPAAEVIHAASGYGLALLEPALREGLVESERAPTSFRFSHVLVRETLYQDLSAVSRSDLHFAFGSHLEALRLLDGDAVFQIAHHFLAAVPRYGVSKAIEYEVKAAEVALGYYAYELAADHYAQAVHLQSQEVKQTSEDCALMLALADAQRMAGRTQAAGQTLRRVLDLAADLGDTELFARALLGLSNLLRSNTMVDPTYEGLLRNALSQVEGTNLLRPILLATLVEATHFTAPLAERQQWGDEALRLARNSDDASTLTRVLHALVSSGIYSEAAVVLSVTEDMVRAARIVNRAEIVLDALSMHAGSLLLTGDGPAYRRIVDEHQRFANRVRHPIHLYFTEAFKACRSYLDGALHDAENHARTALRSGQPVLETVATMTFAIQLAMLAVEQTEETVRALLREMRTIVDPVLALVPFTGWQALLSRFALAVGDRDEAASWLERLTDNDLRAIARDKNYETTIAQLAIVAVELDDRTRSQQIYEALKPFAGGHLCTSVIPSAYFGPATFYLGLLAAHCGEQTMAQAWFERAEHDCAAVGARTYLGWTQFHRARTISQGDNAPEQVRRARAWLDAAERTAKRCKLPKLIAAIETQRELAARGPA